MAKYAQIGGCDKYLAVFKMKQKNKNHKNKKRRRPIY